MSVVVTHFVRSQVTSFRSFFVLELVLSWVEKPASVGGRPQMIPSPIVCFIEWIWVHNTFYFYQDDLWRVLLTVEACFSWQQSPHIYVHTRVTVRHILVFEDHLVSSKLAQAGTCSFTWLSWARACGWKRQTLMFVPAFQSLAQVAPAPLISYHYSYTHFNSLRSHW